MNNFRSILVIGLLTLTACGGGESETSTGKVDNSSSNSTVTPKVDLTGQAGAKLSSAKKVAGVTSFERATVGNSFSNALGTLRHASADENVQGNLTLGVTASDTDQLQKVSLFLPSANRTYTLCENNCSTAFQSTISGFSPQLANISAGPLRIELVVEDSTGNSVIVDALNLNWQPIQISSVTATRENGVVSVSWSGDSNLQRYNLFAATNHLLTSSNALSLDNGVQLLAIAGTSVEFPDNDPSKYYHLLITGIDGGGESGVSSLFTIPRTDGAPNLPPIANSDAYTVNEDETISVNFLDNDQDPEEQLLSFDSIVQQPLNGTIELDESGNFIYTPQVNFHGKDTARYRIVDSEGGLSEGVVSFEVAPVNDAPIALDDVYGVDVNGEVNSQENNVLSNDSDIDGDVLSVSTSIVENPIHGTVSINANGSFLYISTDVLVENDQFVYQILDNNGGVSNATVTILPNVELLAPVAKNDDYQIDEDTTLVVSQVGNGILANDSDPNNFSFELNNTLLVQPQHGQLNLSLDGTFTYIPDSDFYGVDQFQYQIENVANIVSQAFVNINVNRVSDVPIAVDDNYQVTEDEALTVTEINGVLTNDSDIDNETLSVTIVSSPLSGTVNLSVDGSFTYLPDADFNGVDSFTYKITNEGLLSSTGNVNIVVDAVNDAPTTVTDNIVVDEDGNVIADVLANDSDKEGDLLSLNSVEVDNGTAVIINNSISITPQQNFYGVLNGSYIVSDIYGATSVGSIVVSVNSINDLPIATNDNFNVRENEVLNITFTQSLLINDTDIDGDTLFVNTTPVANVTNGSLILNSNGSFTYTPNMNFDGMDNFTYQINDGNGGTSQANVVLTIIDTVTPNVAPVAVNDNFTIDEGSSLVITNLVANHLLANDTDFENNLLTVNTTPISNVSNGSLTLGNDGSFTYIPSVEFNGTDSFTYQISDGFGDTSQATATITINPINDLPQAIADVYILNEDITFVRLVSDVDQLLSNDTDIDLDTLTVFTTPVTNVTHGGLTLNADGSFTYIPNADFNGTDSFIYKISDGNGGTSQASVDLTITAINDAPTAVNQVFSIDEDKTNNDVVGTVIATDKELDNLTFALTGGDTGLFNIGSTTGVITVNGISPLDYETSIQHTLTVTISDDGLPLNESTEIVVTINLIDTTEPVTLNETVSFGRPAIGFVELTGIKTQAKLADSVRVGNKIYFVGNIDNVDKDIYIIAYEENGKLVNGFGSSGIQTFDFGHDEYATSIVETGGKFYIAFNSNDGTYTEVCFLKIDNDADLVTDFGSNGVRCTTEKSSLSVNDTTYNGKDIFAVGKVQTTDSNLLVIQIDKDGDFIDHTPGDPADSPHIIQDISGLNLNDEGMAIYNANNNDILIAGNVETSAGDQDIFAWLLDEDGIVISSFNGGNARFYDVNGTDDTVNAAVGKKESDFTAHLVGSTILANGKKEALIIAIDKISDLETNFAGSGIVTYDADGDLGAGTGSSEFTDIVFEGSKLYVSGTLFDSQTKQFATHIKMSDGTIDASDLPVGGYKKINYGGDSAFAQSISLDGHRTMWLSGYVESGGETDMIISAVDDDGDLCNEGCKNDFSDGKEILSHSSTASNDSVAGIVQIQNGAQQGKFLIASVADDGSNDHIILTRVTNTGALDTSFSADGHKQLKIATNARVKGLFELADGKFIVYGDVTESTVVNGFIARIDQNGVLDNSFADNGIYTTASISATSIQFSQAISDNSGKFIAVGALESGSTRSFILRLTSTGVLDTSFNGQGYIIGNASDDFASVIIDASNNIYAAGSRTSLLKDMLVIKYLNNGSLDTSFNGSGVLTVDVNILTNDSVKKITFDNSSNLYLIGNAALLSAKIAVVKISTTGTLDTSFSGNGIASFIMAPLSGKAGVYDAAIDNNNNIVVVGFGQVLGEDAEMIGRIKANGTLDTSFNGQGYFEANVCTNAAQLTSVLLLSNNALVVAGQCYIDATFRNDIEFSQYQLN